MEIQDVINSGVKITLAVESADLREFAHTLIRETRQDVEREIEERNKEVYYTSHEAEEVLRVDKSTMWRWSKRGYLTPIKVGGLLRYRKSDVDRILDHGKTPRK